MTYGIDTDFLVALEIRDHLYHHKADRLLNRLLDDGHDFALAPQTLAEFLHVVTDARRMPTPLSMNEALARARDWWEAKEVLRVFPEGHTSSTFMQWMRIHKLGRKRLLDTLLAATMDDAGIKHLITNNTSDFEIFKAFELLRYA